VRATLARRARLAPRAGRRGAEPAEEPGLDAVRPQRVPFGHGRRAQGRRLL